MQEDKTPYVQFVDCHRPVLKDGKYTIQIRQDIEQEGIPAEPGTQKDLTFWVAGEQYVLNPKDVGQKFPPAGSVADHSNTFPHIVLNRSTLPWERRNAIFGETSSWLVLLLFTEDEMSRITEEVQTLEKAGFKANAETGQSPTDKLSMLSVPLEILHSTMPDEKEIQLLSHVRQGTDREGNPLGEEKALIMCHRLPKKGEESTLHLVSFETDPFDEKDHMAPAMLVSLASWKFRCPDHYKVTQESLDRLKSLSEPLADRLQAIEGSEYFKKDDFIAALKTLNVDYEETVAKYFHFGTFTSTLSHLNRTPSTLRLPDKNPKVDSYLQSGFVAAPHFFRKGAQSVSWYHSPLSTGRQTESAFLFPVKAADTLYLYDEQTGMFDISYACAWELGRLWALADKRFSTELFQWKRKHTHEILAAEQMIVHQSDHLPTKDKYTSPIEELPDILQKGFEDLRLLKGIPFNYLVPDEAMLPVESIRFFYVDELFMDCLIDGAFSIGRLTDLDHTHDILRKPATNVVLDYETRTGFIMRSDVISGWPGMIIEGFNREGQQLPLHQTQLSENVVLCLFDGKIHSVVMHLKPESIHWGVDVHEDGSYHKHHRKQHGNPIPVSFKEGNLRIVDICQLYTDLGNDPSFLNSAVFGQQMVEPIEKVVFLRSDD